MENIPSLPPPSSIIPPNPPEIDSDMIMDDPLESQPTGVNNNTAIDNIDDQIQLNLMFPIINTLQNPIPYLTEDLLNKIKENKIYNKVKNKVIQRINNNPQINNNIISIPTYSIQSHPQIPSFINNTIIII